MCYLEIVLFISNEKFWRIIPFKPEAPSSVVGVVTFPERIRARPSTRESLENLSASAIDDGLDEEHFSIGSGADFTKLIQEEVRDKHPGQVLPMDAKGLTRDLQVCSAGDGFDYPEIPVPGSENALKKVFEDDSPISPEVLLDGDEIDFQELGLSPEDIAAMKDAMEDSDF